MMTQKDIGYQMLVGRVTNDMSDKGTITLSFILNWDTSQVIEYFCYLAQYRDSESVKQSILDNY